MPVLGKKTNIITKRTLFLTLGNLFFKVINKQKVQK